MTRDDLIGTWRLRDFQQVTDGKTSRPWGDDMEGLIVYAPDGYMSVIIRRPGSVLGYSGPFEIDGEAVLHHIKLATGPELVGTTQRRKARLEGDRLTLTSEVSLYGGPGTSANLYWQRAPRA